MEDCCGSWSNLFLKQCNCKIPTFNKIVPQYPLWGEAEVIMDVFILDGLNWLECSSYLSPCDFSLESPEIECTATVLTPWKTKRIIATYRIIVGIIERNPWKFQKTPAYCVNSEEPIFPMHYLNPCNFKVSIPYGSRTICLHLVKDYIQITENFPLLSYRW